MNLEHVDLGDLGKAAVVDLTQPLSEDTPVIQLPEPYANTPSFSRKVISEYDERGPIAYWYSFETGEHVGTHLDAPNHWISGRGGASVDEILLRRLIAPAVVLDKTEEVAANPDYLLTRDDVDAFISEHGPLPSGGWLLYRTGWGKYANDAEKFFNADDDGPHTPGVTADCARWLAEETDIIGFGVETVGTDTGQAFTLDPIFPMHNYMHGAGKLGLTQLANLELLPPVGAILVVAPLKIVGGTGSPVRVFALLP